MKIFLPKQAKISITVILGILNAYIVYALTACYVVWLKQPRFVLPGGGNTSSLGFIVTLLIFAAIFLITLSALIVTSVIFYKNSKKNYKSKQTKEVDF